jgi:hypothetical protein
MEGIQGLDQVLATVSFHGSTVANMRSAVSDICHSERHFLMDVR